MSTLIGNQLAEAKRILLSTKSDKNAGELYDEAEEDSDDELTDGAVRAMAQYLACVKYWNTSANHKKLQALMRGIYPCDEDDQNAMELLYEMFMSDEFMSNFDITEAKWQEMSASSYWQAIIKIEYCYTSYEGCCHSGQTCHVSHTIVIDGVLRKCYKDGAETTIKQICADRKRGN